MHPFMSRVMAVAGGELQSRRSRRSLWRVSVLPCGDVDVGLWEVDQEERASASLLVVVDVCVSGDDDPLLNSCL